VTTPLPQDFSVLTFGDEVEAATQGMVAQGIPRPFVEALMARYSRDLGRPAQVTGEVERILGRPARTYARWVRDHAAAFAR
jgi:hypothetical protein